MSKLVKRIVIYVETQLHSPLSVSSGEDEWTDSDVLKDADGVPFVSGASLAGAMWAYLEYQKNESCLMGYAGRSGTDDTGRMSSLFISDMTFDEPTVSSVRDGVRLDANKTAVDGSKYDMEILEAGSRAHFYMELAIRSGDDEAGMKAEISKVFHGIRAGEIRLGKKKTRGFGELALLSVRSRTYNGDNLLEYAKAYQQSSWEKAADRLTEWLSYAAEETKLLHIEVPLKLQGGISIRQYAAKKGEPDFRHICDHGVPVIPGSSLAGAVRHRMDDILRDLYGSVEAPAESGKKPSSLMKYSKADVMHRAFGCVEKTEAKASDIIFSEAEIQNARELTMVRTGVSRFESAVKKGALYKEKTYVGGEAVLHIAVRKRKDSASDQWITGLLLLALKDLQNGFLAVGGQTAIGRGIFAANGPIRIDGAEGMEDACISEAWERMNREGAC